MEVSSRSVPDPGCRASGTGRIRTGQVQVNETIVDGLERAPEAFLGMLRGENLGKMVVRI